MLHSPGDAVPVLRYIVVRTYNTARSTETHTQRTSEQTSSHNRQQTSTETRTPPQAHQIPHSTHPDTPSPHRLIPKALYAAPAPRPPPNAWNAKKSSRLVPSSHCPTTCRCRCTPLARSTARLYCILWYIRVSPMVNDDLEYFVDKIMSHTAHT